MTNDPSKSLDLVGRLAVEARSASTVDEVKGAADQTRREIEELMEGKAVTASAAQSVSSVEALGVAVVTLRGQLASAQRARESLLAGLSHDLRNPLNTFAMSAGLLRDSLERNDVDPTRDLGLLARMERAVERMQRMIDDMLEASRIDARKISLSPEPESAVKLVREAIAALEPALREKRAQVIAEELADEKVLVDRARGLELFGKVLAYALKTIGEGGTVRIASRADGGAVAFSTRTVVAAQGTGRSGMEEGKGGVTLLIARGLAESHGGTFNFDANDGVTIVFTLPVAG